MINYKCYIWFQLIGVLAGFIVPSVVLLVIFKEFIYCAFGATIGIFLDVCMDAAKYGNSPDKDISKICKNGIGKAMCLYATWMRYFIEGDRKIDGDEKGI